MLILREPSSPASVARLEILNADGSMAEQCGNGVRCVALYLHTSASAPDGTFSLDTPAGPVQLECLSNGLVRVNMGIPNFDPASLPTTLQPDQRGWCHISVDEDEFALGVVSMGNPHAVLLVEDPGSVPVERLGAAISQHEAFPNGCNVGFASVTGPNEMSLRVFERGAGETLACGSGACAAASFLVRTGALSSPVSVQQAGGSLMIELCEGTGSVWKTGPAEHVFNGEITWGDARD